MAIETDDESESLEWLTVGQSVRSNLEIG